MEQTAAHLVFVSGASSGLGRAIAQTVPFPARVVAIGRRPLAGADHLAADLAEPAGWERVASAFARALADFSGERVVFVHAAGTLDPIGFAGEVEEVAYRRQVLLNAAAPLVLGDAFLRALPAGVTRADLVLVSSGAAHHVYEGWSAYGAGKAAVDQWVRTVGAEQQRRGGRCRVLAVAPGVVATPMQEQIRTTAERDFPQRARFVALYREGGLREPAEAAREIWQLLDEPLENGAVVDLRARPAAAAAGDAG